MIKLEDASLWHVDAVDTVDTAIWLPVSNVVICGSKMINVDDNETASVMRISPGKAPTGSRNSGYIIQASSNDETFVINGNVFKAQTYCFDLEKGDSVIFVEGSALGACASAKFLDTRNNKICAVWCE